MIISSSKKFVFVHINKNAGTSISNQLIKYQDNNKLHKYYKFLDKKIRYLNYNKGNGYLIGLSIIRKLNKIIPLNYRYLKIHEKISSIPTNIIKEYFKFAVFRDPLERYYSLYNFALQRKHDLLNKIASQGLEFFTNKMLSNEIDVGKQSELIKNKKGEISIDYLINFNNLNNDFKIVCEKLALDINSLDHDNLGLHQNPAVLPNHLKDKVKKYFEEDFYIFNNITKFQKLD